MMNILVYNLILVNDLQTIEENIIIIIFYFLLILYDKIYTLI
jgi:hypothetical protein